MVRSWRQWTVAGAVVVLSVGVGLVGGEAAADTHRRSSQPDAEEVEQVVPAPNSSTGSCGVERWSVKTGTDADSGKITLQSTTATTIASLGSLTAPSSLPANNRVLPTEATVFRLSATLTQYKLEADSDYHLVLSDGSGHSMIAEIPDPACVGAGSPLASSIQKARGEFDTKYTATGSFQNASVPVTVTGVGFFDFLHGQTGVAPNGIELHTVSDIQFGTGSGMNTVTVTNPGSRTATVGTATSLQIVASDSASGQTLSYAATGLPAGLSINTSSGLISGTPSTAGTSSVKVTVTDPTGASASTSFSWTVTAGASGVPRPDHVVVVMMENHSYANIIGSSSAPYINSLASSGATFTHSFAVTHPSEPNYLALFSGSTQGLTSDSCPNTFTGANLGSELIAKQLSFTGYSETMPSNGYTGCTSGAYARKHNPWVNFSNVPAASNLAFSSFPTTYSSLPTLSFVIPNLADDMHDGTIAQGDTWLQQHIDAFAQWAKTHNSLLVLTWDEDDNSSSNQIPTILVGAQVKSGSYSETINHYSVLRTLEDAYGLPYAGASATATPITDVWTASGGGTNTVTVTNPGSQTGTVGTATSLQIRATDSASGQSLTYSASGLPAGLTISPSSGLISGTPTTAATSNVTVTATDGTGARGTASFSWTVAGSGGSGCSGQKLGNPGFETGTAAPWTATSGVISNSATEPPHTGTWDAWLDGYGTAHTQILSQGVSIPAGCHASLSYWLHIDTAETTTSTAYDALTVKVGTTTLATYSNLNHNNGYSQKTLDLSSYAGQSITIAFTGVEDSTKQTSFVIDDTALTLS